MEVVVGYVQLIANLSALAVIGWLYAAYTKNLRAAVELKDAQIQVMDTNLRFWRDKAEELEKRTPEHIERVLADRIRIREEEMARLKQDTDRHRQKIRVRSRELARLRFELQKAKDVGRNVVVWDSEAKDEVVVPTSELELVKLGEVGVDSASLMICDPAYTQSEWHQEEYIEPERQYIDTQSERIYEFRKDFNHYDDVLLEIGKTVNELISSGRLVGVEHPDDPTKFTMSLAGALYASSNKGGYGALRFNNGGDGAGIVVRTVYGDGMYPVYGERHQGHIVRVYVDLQ